MTIKGHVAPHFKLNDLRNAGVSLMMLLATDDASVSGSGVTLPKIMLHLILIFVI